MERWLLRKAPRVRQGGRRVVYMYAVVCGLVMRMRARMRRQGATKLGLGRHGPTGLL